MPVSSSLRHPFFLWASGAILIAALALLVWAGLQYRWGDAVAWALIALVAGCMILVRDRFPPLFGFLISLTAAVNGAGYALTLWHEETSFDEIVHAFTTFAGMAGIGWALLGTRFGSALSSTRLFSTIVTLGFGLGVVWECFEALIGISGTPKDTLIDLIMDTGGAIAAAKLLGWLQKNEARR